MFVKNGFASSLEHHQGPASLTRNLKSVRSLCQKGPQSSLAQSRYHGNSQRDLRVIIGERGSKSCQNHSTAAHSLAMPDQRIEFRNSAGDLLVGLLVDAGSKASCICLEAVQALQH